MAHAYELSEESGPIRRAHHRARRHRSLRDALSGGASRRAAPVLDRCAARSGRAAVRADRGHGGHRRASTARTAAERVAADIPALYRRTQEHYARLDDDFDTRDDARRARSHRAFDWALVGMDKGLATNPALGTGLVAGFRTSGNSERPGFAWFFGRDALWTSLALTASGALDTARTALAFLAKFQREDGKIPHEISQSAALVPWFTEFPYAWASADATPLYVIAHADLLARRRRSRVSPAVLAVDRQGLRLLHGNRRRRQRPHREQRRRPRLGGRRRALSAARGDLPAGAVDRGVAQLCRDGARDAGRAAGDARAGRRRTDARGGRVHLLAGGPFALCVRDGAAAHYAAGCGARAGARAAAAAPERVWRTRRASTKTRCCPRSRCGGARSIPRAPTPSSIASGAPRWPPTGDTASCPTEASSTIRCRITTDRSGRSSLAGRRWRPTGTADPHIGYQALMANALLTESSTLGYVTELLSGDLNAAFGRSSHHQVWSEAMVVTPLVRGLLGIETAPGRRVGSASRRSCPPTGIASARSGLSGGSVSTSTCRAHRTRSR